MQIQQQGNCAGLAQHMRQRPSAEQLQQQAASAFEKLDSSQKGYLEQADFTAILSGLSGAADEEQSSAWFSQLDADQDGKLTATEFSTAVSEQLYDAKGLLAGPRGMPPMGPPPADEGKTLEELTAMAEELSSVDSQAAAGLQSIIEQFDSADQNQDGKVTMQEAMALQEQQGVTQQQGRDTDSRTTGDRQLQQTLLQLLKSYGQTGPQVAEQGTALSATA